MADDPNGSRTMGQQLPDDLIHQICLRCNLESVHIFKCVSKTWNHRLSSPPFRTAYISLRPPVGYSTPPKLLGFFQFNRQISDGVAAENEEEDEPPAGYSFLPVDIEGEPIYHLPNYLPKQTIGSIRCISNGLVLSGDHPNYHVFNPFTRELFSLPRPSCGLDNFLYQADTPGFFSSIHNVNQSFKVIVPYFPSVMSSNLWLATYSSSTGIWKRSRLHNYSGSGSPSGRLLSWSIGGCFIWYSCLDRWIIFYNPNRDNEVVQKIMLPSQLVRPITPFCLSDNGFLQGAAAADDRGYSFHIYSLSRNLSEYGSNEVIHESEWKITYNVKINNLNAEFYQRQHSIRRWPCILNPAVPLGFHPYNPKILYFRLGERIYSCDIEDGGVRRIPHGGDLSSNAHFVWPYEKHPWPPSPLPSCGRSVRQFTA